MGCQGMQSLETVVGAIISLLEDPDPDPDPNRDPQRAGSEPHEKSSRATARLDQRKQASNHGWQQGSRLRDVV